MYIFLLNTLFFNLLLEKLINFRNIVFIVFQLHQTIWFIIIMLETWDLLKT